jgi:hypothetical protein
MKYTKKNKLQWYGKNNRKKDKIIIKMCRRYFRLAIGIYQYNFDSFYRAFDGASFERRFKVLSFP